MKDHIFEMQLLKGSCVEIEGLEIRPYTLGELVDDIGLEQYYHITAFITIQKRELNAYFKLKDDIYEKTSLFQMLLLHEVVAKSLVDFFKFITRYEVEVEYLQEWQVIIIEQKNKKRVKISHSNIDNIINKILKAYCITIPKEEEDDFNPANEQARLLMERIKKNRAKAPKPKAEVDIASIISALAWKSNNLNIHTVWDLTLYQLYDGFYRLDIIDNYDKTLTALYAGTLDGTKVKLKKQLWYRKYAI